MIAILKFPLSKFEEKKILLSYLWLIYLKLLYLFFGYGDFKFIYSKSASYEIVFEPKYISSEYAISLK